MTENFFDWKCIISQSNYSHPMIPPTFKLFASSLDFFSRLLGGSVECLSLHQNSIHVSVRGKVFSRDRNPLFGWQRGHRQCIQSFLQRHQDESGKQLCGSQWIGWSRWCNIWWVGNSEKSSAGFHWTNFDQNWPMINAPGRFIRYIEKNNFALNGFSFRRTF